MGFNIILGLFAKYVDGRGKLVRCLINSTIRKENNELIPILKKVEYLCDNAISKRITIPIPLSKFVENLKYSFKKFVRCELK
jgi:hypothetical protein